MIGDKWNGRCLFFCVGHEEGMMWRYECVFCHAFTFQPFGQLRIIKLILEGWYSGTLCRPDNLNILRGNVEEYGVSAFRAVMSTIRGYREQFAVGKGRM